MTRRVQILQPYGLGGEKDSWSEFLIPEGCNTRRCDRSISSDFGMVFCICEGI
jgi:hypothetical protein